jgi:hypothetical protein
MSDHVAIARATPVLAAVLGSALMLVFWACCLLGPAMLVGVAAQALGAGAVASAMLAALSLAATIVALKRALDHPDVWRSM